MVKKLPPMHPGEVLREEFLLPLGLSARCDLAKACGVPRTRDRTVANEETAITADTALRLGKALGTSAQLWLNLQNEFDVRTAIIRIGKELEKISPVTNRAAAIDLLPALQSGPGFVHLPLPRIQNPSPVAKRHIDALLPERRAKLHRQLVQHRRDGLVGEVAEIGMHGFAGEQRHRFAVGADCAVRTRPSKVTSARALNMPERAGWPASTRRCIQARRGADGFRDVEDAAVRVPALAQADTDAEITTRP